MTIPDDSIAEEPGFNQLIRKMRSSTEPAIRSLITCVPDRIVIGVSPETYWDGPDSEKRMLDQVKEWAGGLPVTMSTNAVRAALEVYGGLKRIAVITPYLPVGDDTVQRFFTDCGYDVVAIRGLGSYSPSRIAHISEKAMREAIIAVDSPDVQAIVQVGTNVAMARMAAVAEAWIDKPVISNNTVLYWHALRDSGVNDRIHGLGSLLAEH
jgi:maleate isomerase